MRLRWLLPLFAGAGAGYPEVLAARGSLEGPPTFPLRTSSRYVVDAQGRRVRLQCVNWYGAHLPQMVVNGLNRRPAGDIARAIAAAGFNCVRLPFSLDNVMGNFSRVPDPKVSLAGNPELQDLTPLEVFDATLRALTDQGVMVILNNHVSTSEWCCSTSDRQGLWYTTAYPESAWLDALGVMAARYKDNPLVVGFDLRNEIRPSGLVWPGWNTQNNKTDWTAAAVRGAHRVTEANDNMLIIISGTYFSVFLCQVPSYPVHEKVPSLAGRVIYTAHEYNWFNFHLMSRQIILLYCLGLAVAVLGLWSVVLLARRASRRHDSGGVARRLFCCFRCLARCRCRKQESLAEDRGSRSMRFGLGFIVAALCTTLCAICLKVFPAYVQTCDFNGFLVALLCAILAPTLGVISFALWIRAGFLAVMQYLGPSELRILQSESSPPSAPSVPLQLEQLEQRPCEPASSEQRRQLSCTYETGARHADKCRKFRWVFLLVSCVAIAGLVIIWMDFGTYEAFEAELNFKWGFMLTGGAMAPAPVWLGEFGTNSQSLWWQHMLTYIQKHDLDFAYWSVNGEKYNGVPESFGLFMEDFQTVRHPWKLQQLQAVMNFTFELPRAVWMTA